jgi:hypothetical protein
MRHIIGSLPMLPHLGWREPDARIGGIDGPHSPLMPAALMIGHHFSISAWCKAPSASPGQEQEAPQCLWAPAGTRAIIDLLYREIARAIATPELAQKMTAIGFEPAAVPPEEVAARIKADMPKWAALIRAAKIKPYD